MRERFQRLLSLGPLKGLANAQFNAKKLWFTLIALVTLSIIFVLTWMIRLDQNIQSRFAEKRFAPPVEFYSAPESVRIGQILAPAYFESLFARKNFRSRVFGQPLQPGDDSIWSAENCRSLLTSANPPGTESSDPGLARLQLCIAFRNNSGHGVEDDVQVIALDSDRRVLGVYKGASPLAAQLAEIEPELFAQYYGDQPVLRKIVSLGEAPPLCLNALLAIEDSQFLEHSGVSFTGLFRAFLTNLRSGRVAQGGSTITQQLVKNYFLTEERTFRRKATEILMAFLVENRATKDEILETYINLIYMGQNGPFQVRGFAAASEHYFGRPLSDLNLEECALTAAIVNSPGLFNPFNHPDNARKRRARVLDRMAELKMISQDDADRAKNAPLPSQPQRSLTEPAPYFVQAVRRHLATLGIDESEGLRVYTTLDLRAQEAAQQAVRSGLDRLEKNFAHIKKLKQHGKNLEAILVSADPATGDVQALVGGRGFLATQFNRVTDSRRQVGSVMKPFVYLTALESLTQSGEPYTPLTIVKDQATTHHFEGQTWTPHNYEGTYRGDVPLYYALKESLNASTASLGISVGLSNIIDTARRMGITSPISPVPSLTLGAFELSPLEVLQAYSTIARLGEKTPLTLFRRVESLNGKAMFERTPKAEQVAASENVAELVGIMKQVMQTGTGRGARLSGFVHPSAGKTGTTNDKKDAWFAGFTPYHTAVVWVGYDDNTSHNLTGASGAVPIWTEYMKAYATHFPADDFSWPASVEKSVLSNDQQLAFGVPGKGDQPLEPVELIFKRGQAPLGAIPPDAIPTPNPFKTNNE
jgi:penicillin-binding protein 1B